MRIADLAYLCSSPVEGGDANDTRFPVLAAIRSPGDVKRLDDDSLRALAAEIRAFIIESVTRTGGHLGAGLGVVELTLALNAEFDFNDHDKLVWDVGHQCYPHKLLTGRAGRFDSLRQWGGVSGFPDPKESAYDTVKTGHGGTSISTAMGFAVAWRGRSQDADRKAVAVIGDGSLQEGNAYEALNHGGTVKDLNLVVVLNDNNMSISPSVGAMSAYLARLRSSEWLTARMRTITRERARMPHIHDVGGMLERWSRSLHGVTPHQGLGILFEQLGFFYYGPIDGHDIDALRRAFSETRSLRCPVLIHAITRKGRGYMDNVPETTCYHAAPPSKIVTAQIRTEYPDQGGTSFTAAFTDQAITMAERDPRLVVITAAMLEGTGLVKFQQRFPERCLDVGMAEQHGVALAAGLALAGHHPICAIYSTFLQRAYDQMFQEVALQKARVLFCLDRGGLAGSDGATHNGVFDVAYLRCLPNFALMAPRDTGELVQMMELAGTWDGPVAIRFPRGAGTRASAQLPHVPFHFGEAERVADGSDGCILAYGPMTYAALEVRRRVLETTGRTVSVINARFAKPLDEALLRAELERQPIVFTLEDHAVAGGFGAAVAELALTALRGAVDAAKLDLLGLPDRFIDHGDRTHQLADARLDVETLTRHVVARLAALPAQPRSSSSHAHLSQGTEQCAGAPQSALLQRE